MERVGQLLPGLEAGPPRRPLDQALHADLAEHSRHVRMQAIGRRRGAGTDVREQVGEGPAAERDATPTSSS